MTDREMVTRIALYRRRENLLIFGALAMFGLCAVLLATGGFAAAAPALFCGLSLLLARVTAMAPTEDLEHAYCLLSELQRREKGAR